jgi:hypothetical protein
MDRREFLKGTAAAGAAAVLPLSILPETKSTSKKVWTFMYGKEVEPGCWDGCGNLFVWFENHPTSPDMFDVCVVGEFAGAIPVPSPHSHWANHRYRVWEGCERNILSSVQPEDEIVKKVWPKAGMKSPIYAEICTIRHAACLLFAARGFRPSHWPQNRPYDEYSQLYVPDNWVVPEVIVADMRSYENG